MLAIIGPRTPFQPEEYAAINRYIDGGGRVLIALDPENKVDMHEVLQPLNLEFKAEPLANEQAFARRLEQKISDRANLVTATFSSSPVGLDAAAPGPACIGRVARRGLDQHQAGSHRGDPGRRADQGALRHLRRQERQLHPDPGEEKRAWELAATAIKKDARVFVIADSDWIGDEAIKVPGNGVLALDVIHWLMGDEAFSGQTSTEADVKITHTQQAGRRLVLLDDLPRPGAGDRRRRHRHPQIPAQAPPGQEAAAGRPPRRPLRRHRPRANGGTP